MTPKQKAKELVNRFLPHSQDTEHKENNNIWEEKVTEAIQCALICVDEIQEHAQMIETPYEGYSNPYEYLKRVKQEIENL